MILALASTGVLAVGYALGRLQPARRASEWAAWQRYDRRPTGLRRATVWTVLTAEELVMAARLLVLHPREFVHAWRHRKCPPRPAEAPRFDPNWREKHRTTKP